MKLNTKDLFKALAVPNYRTYFTGQGISLIGTWMQRTTMGWYVYRLTDSPLLLGLIMFFSQIPSIFIGPFSGVWADRLSRHTILKMTSFTAFLQATFLAILVLTNNAQIWHIIVFSLLSGVTEAIDAPARQAFVIELVEKKSLLTNAIAMNSAMFNGARLIGPSLAGIIIGFSNEGFCFLINGISYIAVIISLFKIQVPVREVKDTGLSMLHKIKEGWRYSFSHLPIKFLIANISVLTVFGMSYAVLMPIFARDILMGTAKTMGFLMSMAGVGALTGAMYLASRTSIKGLSRILSYAMTGLSFALIMFSMSHSFVLSMGLMLLVGIGMSFQMATSNTILQTIIDDNMRGRVMSLHSMAFMAVAPFGSLLAGWMSKVFGAPVTLSFCALICLIWAFYGFVTQKRFVAGINSMIKKTEPEIIGSDYEPDYAVGVAK
jgi:MFS family permease